MRLILLLLVAAIGPLPAVAAAGGDLTPEQAVLQRRVGTWHNVNIIKPGPWNPQGSRQEWVETIRWTLGRAFIEGNAVAKIDGRTNTHLVGWDAKSRRYLTWYFDSEGTCPQALMSGTWDEAAQTLRFTSELPDGVAAVATLKFVDQDHINWAATWTAKDGKVMLEMTATQTRHRESPGAKVPETEPEKLTAPDPKGPAELRRLTGFIGDWNASVRDNAAEHPTWTEAGTNHKSWTLGGRFLRDEVLNQKKEHVMLGFWTFDPVTRKHREWYFRADGGATEIEAGWDDRTSTFHIDGKQLGGGTIRGPRRIDGPDSYIWDAVVRNDEGRMVLDLSGKQQRVKP